MGWQRRQRRLQLEAPASVAAVSGPSLKRVPTVSDLMNVIQAQPEVGDEIRAIYGRRDLDDEQKLIAIQKMVALTRATAAAARELMRLWRENVTPQQQQQQQQLSTPRPASRLLATSSDTAAPRKVPESERS